MRGNKDWAPPRKQIIFHVKTPSKNLIKDLSAQGYRCTGCGMKVAPSHARYFRFCNYTGKYFCQNCHTNAVSIIPAQIIDKWSFKKYPVSNFARDLLTNIQQDPVFNVQTVNRHIYSRVPSMAQALDLRLQLVSVRQYLKLCRKARNLYLTFEGYSPWTTDLHLYSMDDFNEVKSGVKVKHLRALLADAVQHIKTCPICQGKGFVCEFCKDPSDVIYPFEIHKVSSCKVCRCCFHKECFRGKACPRCIRVQERQRQRESRQFKEEVEAEDRDRGSPKQPI